MGRYIDGDIDHKLWFGTQASDAASQFGGESEVGYIPYYYSDMDEFYLGRLNHLIEQLNKKYSVDISLDTDPELLYELGKTKEEKADWWIKVQNDQLVADTQLGLRIYQCILKKGSCEFTAEC